jgi:ATP-binding cassette subfamily F protein uup
VLDEPTNDLDIPTLDVLEEALLEFAGAVVLVTHDRFLLDRVSTRVLALDPEGDGEGGTERYADVSQYLEARKRAEREARAARAPSPPPADRAPGRSPAAGRKKLSYREQREWEGMEEAVLAAEDALAEAERGAADPAIASDSQVLQERWSEVEERRTEVERLYARWAELEEMKGG